MQPIPDKSSSGIMQTELLGEATENQDMIWSSGALLFA